LFYVFISVQVTGLKPPSNLIHESGRRGGLKSGGWRYRPPGFLCVLYIFSCTDKKENKIFLIYKEIQMGSGVKSWGSEYRRKCANFSPYMRRPLVIHDFATDPSEFPFILGNYIFFFISAMLETQHSFLPPSSLFPSYPLFTPSIVAS
jgi:hypothetical protein